MNEFVLPSLSEDEYEALKEDIRRHGVIVPVVIDQHGAVVDGHHRVRACKELGIEDFPTITRIYPDEDSRLEDALKLNLQRRHVSREQLKEIAIRLYHERKWSLFRIARTLGVARSTVYDWVREKLQWLQQVSEFGHLLQPLQADDYSAGADGKIYPRSVFAKNKKEREQVQQLIAALGDEEREQLPASLDVHELKRQVRQSRLLQHAPADPDSLVEVELYNEDFRTGMERLPDDSIELVFTDPPYGREFIPLYGDLARLAARKLVDGGSLLVYVGHYAIGEVIRLMSEHLRYFWLISEHGYEKCARCANLPGYGISVTWKPILWFVKGFRWNTETFVSDSIELPSLADKSYHEWAQHIATAEYYITWLTRDGDTVVDPFAGSGTTLLAAWRLKRKAIGFEVDHVAYLGALRRLHDVQLREQKETA